MIARLTIADGRVDDARPLGSHKEEIHVVLTHERCSDLSQ